MFYSVQATAIGQALLEAGFIEPVIVDNIFSDTATVFKPATLSQMQSMDLLTETQTTCDAQEPAWVKTIPQHDSTTGTIVHVEDLCVNDKCQLKYISDSESETRAPNPIPVTTGRLPSSSSSFYLDLNLESSTVTLKRPTSEDLTTLSVDSSDSVLDQKEESTKSDKCNLKIADDLLNDTLQVQEVKERNGWHKPSNIRTSFGELHTYERLT